MTLETTISRSADDVGALIAAIEGLRYDESKRPKSDGLRLAWPDFGRIWIAEWARELGRDLATIGRDLQSAAAAGSEEEALEPLENAFWRLGAAREKLYAVIALAYGIPSLRVGSDQRQTLSFKPDGEACRIKLRDLQKEHEPARRILDLDGKVRQSLLLRHQATHSLAPLIRSHSLTWYEAALVERGGVREYQAYHLPPKGLTDLADIGAEALRDRSQILATKGFAALVDATAELALLFPATAELEPPVVLWKVMETGECFFSLADASVASRAAVGEEG